MVRWLGPSVVGWSYFTRILAYTAACTIWAMCLEMIFSAFHYTLRGLGLLSKNQEKRPTRPAAELIVQNLFGWFFELIGVGAVLALFNPTPDSWTYVSTSYDGLWHYNRIVVFALVAHLTWDTWYFFVHRFMHMNKWIYRQVHKQHHIPDASMSVLTAAYTDPVDSFLAGVPLALVVAVACFWLQSYQYYALTLHGMLALQILGHSGAEICPKTWVGVAHLPLAPTLLSSTFVANTQSPDCHASHHSNPSCNFALFSTVWDDVYGTARPAYPSQTPILMLLDTAFSFVYWRYLLWCLIYGVPQAAAIMLATQLLPCRLQAVLLAPLSRWLPRLHLWDYIRVKGRDSPVSCLDRCALSVGRVLMAVPGGSCVFRALGCCGSSWEELTSLLTDAKVPSSVAITPDGFSQVKHLGTYTLTVGKKRGFIRLAHATGAALVPVLGIGEPDVPMGPSSAILFKATLPARAMPIKVVFGQPMMVAPGESMEETHKRYCAELLALGKQHGVLLHIQADD